jgi:hypothetical protein
MPGGMIDVEAGVEQLAAVALVNLRSHDIGKADLPTAQFGERQR